MKLYEAPGDRYQIRKYDGVGFPYGIWDTQKKRFVARGQLEDKARGIPGNLEEKLNNLNNKDRKNREKENKSMNLYGGIKSNFREANSMKVSKDITKNKDFSNSLKKLGYDKIIGKTNAKDNKTLVANNKGDSLVIDKNKGRLNKFKAAGKKANFKKDEEKELMRYKTESAMRKSRFKESAVVNKEADYGSIADIDGIQCYIAGSTQQGYCFKDMSVYENDPNGVCYICEGAFENYVMDNDPDKRLYESYIPVDYVEKNKAKLIEWGSISTRNSIMDEVRAMLGYSWYYDTADGKHIEGKDFDDELVARFADDVIDIVDWQSTSAYINADLDNEDVIGESIEEYYDKKFNTMKESEINKSNLDELNNILGEWDFVGMTGDVTEPYISYITIDGNKIKLTLELWDPDLDDYVSIDGGEYEAPEIIDMIQKADFSDNRYDVADNIVTNIYLKMGDDFHTLSDALYDELHRQRRKDGYEDLEEAEAKKGPTLEEDEYDAVDYFLTDSKMADSGFYIKQDKNMKDFFVDAGENNKKYSLKNGLQVIYEAMVPEYIAKYPKEIQKGLEKVMRKYLGDAVGDEIKSWCSK